MLVHRVNEHLPMKSIILPSCILIILTSCCWFRAGMCKLKNTLQSPCSSIQLIQNPISTPSCCHRSLMGIAVYCCGCGWLRDSPSVCHVFFTLTGWSRLLVYQVHGNRFNTSCRGRSISSAGPCSVVIPHTLIFATIYQSGTIILNPMASPKGQQSPPIIKIIMFSSPPGGR